MNQHDRPDYSAPIPPADDTPQDAPRAGAGSTPGGDAKEPRYLKSEPLPPRSPFEQMLGGAGGRGPGMTGPGMTGPAANGPFVTGMPGMAGMPVTLPRKSLLLAAVLAGLLGPLGMLYSTFLGAFVMTGVWFWTLFLATGMFPIVWIWGMVWALWAAHRKNERRRLVEAHLARM